MREQSEIDWAEEHDLMEGSICHSPDIAQILKHFSPHGVIVRVQVDFDHVVNGVLTPVVVFSRFVKVLQGFVGSSGEPVQQSCI